MATTAIQPPPTPTAIEKETETSLCVGDDERLFVASKQPPGFTASVTDQQRLKVRFKQMKQNSKSTRTKRRRPPTETDREKREVREGEKKAL